MPDSLGVNNRGLHYRFFDVMYTPRSRRYLSEDYGFCRLWRSIGGKIYAHANSNLSHQGSKLYRGKFRRVFEQPILRRRLGLPCGQPRCGCTAADICSRMSEGLNKAHPKSKLTRRQSCIQYRQYGKARQRSQVIFSDWYKAV